MDCTQRVIQVYSVLVELPEVGMSFGLHTEGGSVLVELPEVGMPFELHTEGYTIEYSVLVELLEVGM